MATVIFAKRVEALFGRCRGCRQSRPRYRRRRILCLLGPSGCGKSSTLRMLAGLETVSEGEILFEGRRVNDVPPQRRDMAMVFENYALYPHLDVFDNIAMPLVARGRPRAENSRARDRGQRDAAARSASENASEPALRRTAPACRCRPGDHPPTEDVPARRAARTPRGLSSGAAPSRDQTAPRAVGRDHSSHHPRPGRGRRSF